MVHKDFHLGDIFFTATGAWKVTDVGSRVVVAIFLDNAPEGTLTGPPYSVEEVVFDEYDFGGCSERHRSDR